MFSLEMTNRKRWWQTAIKGLMLVTALLVALTPSMAFADGDDPIDAPSGARFDMMNDLVTPVVLSVVFTLIGLVLFAFAIWLVVKLAPFSVQKEIEEDQNISLGIIIGAIIIGISIILAAAIMG